MKRKTKLSLKWLLLLAGGLLVGASYLISKFSTIEYLLEVHSEIAGVGFGFLFAGGVWLILGKKIDI